MPNLLNVGRVGVERVWANFASSTRNSKNLEISISNKIQKIQNLKSHKFKNKSKTTKFKKKIAN